MIKWVSYDAYRKSEEWAAKKLLVFERDFWLCQSCFLECAEEVHHLTYERLYHEQFADLISLCRGCHWELHKGNERDLVADLKYADKARRVA